MRRKKQVEECMRERLRKLILSRPRTTIAVMIATLGRYISEAHAIAIGRRAYEYDRRRGRHRGKPPADVRALAELGRMKSLSTMASSLCKGGHILRLGKGVYGPPSPKIYENPGQAG